ncbi:DUF1932 domain-containing protein [Azospirillum agricola]|uniref:DUF1932 domain-containing protein n=1 Tax=Azospirillum agricola TaxID=1720247 RepID=UPI000A0F2F3A|nr:NAD(P)-dependent oxidoreductase [Azospirillum agricola]SMH32972.1 3-hydroxyisobutyrate dehydrogenase [Azospirillum lipoferum]
MPASLRIGLIGFGEVGSSFARGFLADGLTGLVAYDEPRSDAQRDLARRRSVELGVPLLDDPAGLADRDLVVCCVPQDQAMAAAERCAGAIAPDALYVDVNSLGPPDKIAVAERVAALGRTFVDAAIMGMPINDLHRVPVLASGEAAQRFAELGGRAGMRIRVAGARPGDAAGVKILRSVVTKGLECLLVESLTAARRHGLDHAVLDSLVGLFGPQSRAVFDFLIRTHAVHARRRSLEVAMCADTLAAAGIDPLVTGAVAARLRRTAGEGLAGGGLAAAANGRLPAGTDDAVALFDRHLDTPAETPA